MLQAEHLSYNITEEGRQSEILTDVSFTVEDGEMLVITGPNGGGKSTLAKLLMGINEATGGKKFIWMMRILQDTILIIVQMRELAMHSSSRRALRG